MLHNMTNRLYAAFKARAGHQNGAPETDLEQGGVSPRARAEHGAVSADARDDARLIQVVIHTSPNERPKPRCPQPVSRNYSRDTLPGPAPAGRPADIEEV